MRIIRVELRTWDRGVDLNGNPISHWSAAISVTESGNTKCTTLRSSKKRKQRGYGEIHETAWEKITEYAQKLGINSPRWVVNPEYNKICDYTEDAGRALTHFRNTATGNDSTKHNILIVESSETEQLVNSKEFEQLVAAGEMRRLLEYAAETVLHTGLAANSLRISAGIGGITLHTGFTAQDEAEVAEFANKLRDDLITAYRDAWEFKYK